jgi:ubiquinone/menaquinone biosynthesis C-methylase UbiE
MNVIHPLYSKLSRYYDLTHYFRNYSKQAEFVHRAIQQYLPNAKRVLDICCGTGTHALCLAGLGYSVTGVDNSIEMLGIAQKKIKPPENKVQFELGDMFDLDYSSKFDVAYCLGTTLMS